MLNESKAEQIVHEYYQIRREMLDLSKRIKSEYIFDTKDETGGSNHLHDYFKADEENRREYGESMEFSEYCCDVLGMDDVCPQCAHVLEMIRKRRELGKKLGAVKNKIMRYGKTTHMVAGQ